MEHIKLAEDVFEKLPNKKTTIRLGRKSYQLGEAVMISTEKDRRCLVNILRVEHCKFANIYESDLQNDGFKDHDDAFEKMQKFYPNMEWDDTYTVVKFSTIKLID